jgi:hypothetical protein
MHFPNLRHLSIRDNDLGCHGAFELPAASFPSLAFLDLRGNELTEEWVVGLSGALLALNALKYLDLRENGLPEHVKDNLMERWPRPITIK